LIERWRCYLRVGLSLLTLTAVVGHCTLVDARPGDSMDSTRDASDDARVCVVATRPATFECCRDGRYPAPASSDRTRASFTYMAFYRTVPVSAVTHSARVVDWTDQRRGEPGPLTAADWARSSTRSPTRTASWSSNSTTSSRSLRPS
jgi:hypothetical protein